MPLEVIVIDNNSTDATADIIRKYPFVTLLEEKKQGQAFAQAVGFNAAKGDIIGRIDADSVLPPDWTGRVLEVFENAPDVVAYTGAPKPYDAKFKRLAVAAFEFFNDHATPVMAGHRLLYGTNCAFRANVWPQIEAQMHLRPDIWEDYDLGFKLARFGKIIWRPDIAVGCSFRKMNDPYLGQLKYHWQAVRTFYLNTSLWRTALQALLRSSVALGFPLILWQSLKRSLKRN